MDWFFQIVLIAMACQGIVRIWFYSDLFARLRDFIKLALGAWVEDRVRTPETTIQAHLAELAAANGESPVPPAAQPTFVRTPVSWEVKLFQQVAPRWVYSLLSCSLCLSTHVAFWLLVFCELVPAFLESWGFGVLGLLFRFPAQVFAVVCMADLLRAIGAKLGHQ